ncbi:hypothetical protein [Flavivirga algicola]|nr:hypothetical protein [Flavivirga algicola]
MANVIFIRHGDIERDKFGIPCEDKLTEEAINASIKIAKILKSKG